MEDGKNNQGGQQENGGTAQSTQNLDTRSLHMRLLADVAHDLSGAVTFPTTLDLAIKMRQTFKNPAITPQELEQMLEMEPIIASKLLQMANLPFYRHEDPVVTELGLAISRLGLERARTAALGIAMEQIMKSKHLAAFDRYAHLNWEHSIRSAVFARHLAQHSHRVDPEEAFLAGLVHDIGIYYLFYRAGEYPEYKQDHQALVELVLGWHESIGESVLHALGLPEQVAEAARDHDQPRDYEVTPRNLSDIVYIANILAGSNWEWLPNSLSQEQLDRLEKTRQCYAEIIVEGEHEIQGLLGALSDPFEK